jgi:outer membrane receptor protein involved in Fe transport
MLRRLDHARKTAIFGCAVSLLALAAAPARAQDETTTADEDEDIIVTATLREQSLIDVPFSINAQTEEDIQRANANTIEDLSRNIAGLTVQNLGPGQSQVSIRGVSAGQIVRDQPGVKEQVGVYLDDSVISLSLFTPDVDLFDLNRLETLRGPQGTLFGSGSVGGTIRYITNQPDLDRVEGLVEGSVNLVDEDSFGGHIKGAINLPLGGNAAVRLVGYGTRYGGFVDAIGPAAGENINDGSRIGGRIALLFQPSDNISITPRVVYQQIRADGFNREERYNLYHNQFLTPPRGLDRRQQYLLLREEFKDDFLLADLTARIGFGGVELTSVTSYINRDILVSRDASALTGSVGISLGGLGVDPDIAALPSNLRDTTDLEQWTQELRLASTGDGPLQWVVGGFYSDTDRVYAQRLPTPGYDAFIDAAPPPLGPGTSAAVANGFPLNSPYNADLPYDIQQLALFGEATYDFGQFELTAGARYYDFEETRDFVSGGLFSNGDTRIGDETASDGVSPRLIATYAPNDNFRVNLQVAKGFRLGGVNDPLNLTLCSDEDEAIYGPFQSDSYEDETLWNYEAGVRYSRGPVTFSAAAFYNDIRNLQVTVDAGSCSSRIVLNVEDAHAMGIEAELAVSPLPGLDLSLAGSLVESEFDSSVPEPLATRTGIREGNRLPTVPNFQAAATATYGQRLSDDAEWYVTGSFQHVGSRYTQPGDQEAANSTFNFIFYDPTRPNAAPGTGGFGTINGNFGSLRLPSYNLVNLSAGVRWDSGLETVLFVTNLFDESALLSLDRERGGRARLGYNISTPRVIGLTVRKRFGS